VIAGYHLDADSRCDALPNGLERFFPRRVDQADQTKEDESGLNVAKCELAVVSDGVFHSDAKHALALRSNLIYPREPSVAIERSLFVIPVALGRTHVQQAFRRALYKYESVSEMVVMKRRHEAMLRFERDCVCSRKRLLGLSQIQAAFHGGGQQGALGRIAVDAPDAVCLA
jgi:hypothetical protein